MGPKGPGASERRAGTVPATPTKVNYNDTEVCQKFKRDENIKLVRDSEVDLGDTC